MKPKIKKLKKPKLGGFPVLKYLPVFLLIAVGLTCFYIGFLIPEKFYTSPIQANYAKLFSVIGFTVALSLAFFLVGETFFRVSELKLSKPLLPPLTILKPKPKAKPLSDKLAFRLLLKSLKLQTYVKRRSLDLRRDVQVAGETLSPYLLAARRNLQNPK